MSEKSILIFGSLPPFRSAAASLGLNVTNALAKAIPVTFVIDDLAPPPQEPGFGVIRLRTFRADMGKYTSWQRLFIPGSKGDSLFVLELLAEIGGIVLPAENTLFPLAESVCRARGNWPQAYWHWLNSRYDKHSSVLYGARIYQHRESLAQNQETPAFSLLLENAASIIAASPASQIALEASGVHPTLTLTLCPAFPSNETRQCQEPAILYVAESGHAASYVRADFASHPTLNHIQHNCIHPASRHLVDAIIEASIVVFLGGENHACSPGLALALQMGKPVVTARQKWTHHLAETVHLEIPHNEAFQSLTAALGAMFLRPELKTHVEQSAKEFAQPMLQHSFNALLEHLQEQSSPMLSFSEAHEIEVHEPVQAPASPDEDEGTDPALLDKPVFLDKNVTTAALIGTVPPPPILNQLFPQLVLEKCPRFATDALVANLVSITKDDPAHLLAQIGYEAPVVKTTDDNNTNQRHRAPVTFETARRGLLTKAAISFSCTLKEAISGDKLLKKHKVSLQLPLQVPREEKQAKWSFGGFVKNTGLFWKHDPVRHSMSCAVMIGKANAVFRLHANSADTCYMVAGPADSSLASGNSAAILSTDSYGLLTFKVMALDPDETTPLASEMLRLQMAETGLLLEWVQ